MQRCLYLLELRILKYESNKKVWLSLLNSLQVSLTYKFLHAYKMIHLLAIRMAFCLQLSLRPFLEFLLLSQLTHHSSLKVMGCQHLHHLLILYVFFDRCHRNIKIILLISLQGLKSCTEQIMSLPPHLQYRPWSQNLNPYHWLFRTK